MNLFRALILLGFVGLLSIPFVLRRSEDAAAARLATDKDALRLIVVTPHIEQIRIEFARAFDEWHFAKYQRHVYVDWRSPGGTTEIIKLLAAQYTDRFNKGLIKPDGSCAAGVIDFDVVFGGGSYDHGSLRTGIKVKGDDGRDLSLTMSVPPSPPFSQDDLDRVFGENVIGSGKLYQDDRRDKQGQVVNPGDWQHWIGTALSGFGIIYNVDGLKALGLDRPASFEDLRDYRYLNQLALADPRQSGSVATAYDSILNEAARRALEHAAAGAGPREAGLQEGFEAGFRTLQDLCANARYFTSASTQPPLDVSQGEAVAGVAIDFYGRGQAQLIAGGGERMGYIDPVGAVYIDADPVSILRGAPSPDLARRFVEFCLSPAGQALWQFQPHHGRIAGDGLGPREFALRRMPVRRDFYDEKGGYWGRLTDQVNPFEIASKAASQRWRDGMIVIMGCWIDAGDELREAWIAVNQARGNTAIPPAMIARIEQAFYALPVHTMKDGTRLDLCAANYERISADVNKWRDAKGSRRGSEARIDYARQVKANLRRTMDLCEEAQRASVATGG